MHSARGHAGCSNSDPLDSAHTGQRAPSSRAEVEPRKGTLPSGVQRQAPLAGHSNIQAVPRHAGHRQGPVGGHVGCRRPQMLHTALASAAGRLNKHRLITQLDHVHCCKQSRCRASCETFPDSRKAPVRWHFACRTSRAWSPWPGADSIGPASRHLASMTSSMPAWPEAPDKPPNLRNDSDSCCLKVHTSSCQSNPTRQQGAWTLQQCVGSGVCETRSVLLHGRWWGGRTQDRVMPINKVLQLHSNAAAPSLCCSGDANDTCQAPGEPDRPDPHLAGGGLCCGMCHGGSGVPHCSAWGWERWRAVRQPRL